MVLLKGKYGDLLPGKSRIGCLVVFTMIYPCNTGREDASLMSNMTAASHGRRYCVNLHVGGICMKGKDVRSASPTIDRIRRGPRGLSIVSITYKTYSKRLFPHKVQHTQWYNNNPCTASR